VAAGGGQWSVVPGPWRSHATNACGAAALAYCTLMPL
jgi:hypothetical protein